MERTDEDCWRIRLAGSRIGERIGSDPTGRNYLDMVGPAARSQVRSILALVADTPCGYEGTRIIELVSGVRLPIQSLMLPLRSADGEIRQLISANSRLVAPPDSSAGIQLAQIAICARRLIDIGAGLPTTPLPSATSVTTAMISR